MISLTETPTYTTATHYRPQVSHSPQDYALTYMVEVFELPEADVRKVLEQHPGDVVAAEPDLLRLKFGDLFRFLM